MHEWLQDAVDKFLKMRRDLGVEVKAVIGMSRDFRNPYFLQKWVHDAKIVEGGSSMPPECFDPSSLHEEVRARHNRMHRLPFRSACVHVLALGHCPH